MKKILIFTVLLFSLISCYKGNSQKYLESQGYTNVKIGEKQLFRPFKCLLNSDNTEAWEFTATKDDKSIKGVLCYDPSFISHTICLDE
jgi:hypothetical protein